MQAREEKLKSIISWSENNENVRAVLLISSLVNPLAPVDEFSDLDIELIFENNTEYISDKNWTHHFGNPIAMIEEDENSFDGKHAMKMILYDDHVKVDFKLFSKDKFLQEVKLKELPEDWDIGYKVLIDKEGMTEEMQNLAFRFPSLKNHQKKSSNVFSMTFGGTPLTLQDLLQETKYFMQNLCRKPISELNI